MTLYSVISFFLSPIASTLSDSIGRKPIFILAAVTDSITGMILGLIPNNWVCVVYFIYNKGHMYIVYIDLLFLHSQDMCM